MKKILDKINNGPKGLPDPNKIKFQIGIKTENQGVKIMENKFNKEILLSLYKNHIRKV